jgi:hypothetical protein
LRPRRKRRRKMNGLQPPKELPNIEVLRSFFTYDPETGIIRWKSRADKNRRWNTQFAGQEAGCISQGRYKQIRLNGRGMRYHRVAWALHHGVTLFDLSIDHANGDILDNRIQNLRLATTSDNGRNSRRKAGCELPRGVKRHHRGNVFEAQIRIAPGKRMRLGSFQTAELAHAAYCEAAKKYHGEFARFD